MGFKRDIIPNEEWSIRLNSIMPKIEAGIHGKEEVKEAFILYNDKLTPRKTDMNCGKCVRYVIERLKLIYAGSH